MKRTLITIALLIAAMTASAQTTEKHYTLEGKTFVQSATAPSEQDQATAYLWRDTKGNEYPIILHRYVKGEKAGRVTCYVIRKSAKTGKEYKYYLPEGEKIAEEIMINKQ